MLSLFAPVLGQLITLGVHDRTEGRFVRAEQPGLVAAPIAPAVVPQTSRFEAVTTPSAVLTLSWPRYDLAVGYGVSFLLTPLESKPRDLLVLHYATLTTSYRFRLTTITLNSTAIFGDVNFQTEALRNPASPESSTTGRDPTLPNNGAPSNGNTANGGSTPAQPGAGTTPPATPQSQPAVPQTVRYVSSNTTLTVSHRLSRQLTLGAFATYSLAEGTNTRSRAAYPLTRGDTEGVVASHVYGFTTRDSFNSTVTGQRAGSSNGNIVWSVVANEIWAHAFNQRTSSALGGGISGSRFSQPDGLVAYSVFPNFFAGLSHQEQLARGTLSMLANAYTAPVLDPLRATIDPRVGVNGGLGWNRKRFASMLTGGVALSIAATDANAGAFDNYQAALVMSYRATDWLGFDTGARVAEQKYQNQTQVPLSYLVYVGVDLGYGILLKRQKPPIAPK
jgi:hypothetical protein